ncbi:hypothetical protein [Dictyobacter arantiisoli]|uniref:Uncharacterized protein n=1 Tax=Dictyobacter arantiisoli TaxID=2014874 RepID=A0A5A5T9N3_9CHLR|nr:hypothetical protein [Dictyobacter arantiisoli]GCF08122.1 hypothetical protein KDI_16860 [Dictyobacter arantiisoli]
MNISTGGPHILLFERDQQFATLLASELQLAGYTNHTARTAVEVFDAIARNPIRLVLVNLAQAAAARREFWVALDAQRRDRKVQALTFLCSNLAGYGPRDVEDHSPNTNVDMEIDGMLGLMSLVDAVRARVPNGAIEAAAHTLPRLPRFNSSSSSSLSSQPFFTSSTNHTSGNNTHNTGNTNGLVFNASPAREDSSSTHTPGPDMLPHTPSSDTFASQQAAMPSMNNQNPMPSPATGLPGSNQPSYSEKIRAVLYPNQRTWSAQDSGNQLQTSDFKERTEATLAQPTQQPEQTFTANNDSTVLQRLASGQLSYDGPNESGLAQLSRMAQGFHSTINNEYINTPAQQPATQWTTLGSTAYTNQQAAYTPQSTNYTNQQTASTSQSTNYTNQQTASTSQQTNSINQQSTYTNQQATYTPQSSAYTTQSVESKEQLAGQAHPRQSAYTPDTPSYTTNTASQARANTGNSNIYSPLEAAREQHTSSEEPALSQTHQIPTYTPYHASLPHLTPADEKIAAQPLRASPIQDILLERTISGPAIGETAPKRPDVLSRANYGQVTGALSSSTTQQQGATSHLASIATPMPPVSRNTNKSATVTPPATPEPASEEAKQAEPQQETHTQNKSADLAAELGRIARAREKVTHLPKMPETMTQGEEQTAGVGQSSDDLAESMNTNNAVLLDIVQSLPPMPALNQQQQQSSVQAQVLNGRATRSLNKVLLDGHLVPQDRLDVAQNIQRMLRGVDLNYQLGEILLMFKLLTPDQLLAASLVSYGLITTTQISSLGRIRQELYSIGLEYDLENLLILFRILTPEQLREARSSLQS